MREIRGSAAVKNAAARRVLAYFYSGYQETRGRNFVIRPKAELLERLDLDKQTYVAALGRLVDRDVLKLSGTGHGASLTAFGVEVHEDLDLLEEVLPVPSLTAEQFRRLVVQAHVDAYDGVEGGPSAKEDDGIRRWVLDAAGPRAKDHHFDDALRWMATQRWIQLGAVGDVVFNASFLPEMRAYIDPLPAHEAEESSQPVAARPMRVVMLSSNPRDPDDPDALDQLALDTEFSRMREKLAASEQGRGVDLDYWPDVRLDQLADRLLEAPADVLHFSGHSSEDGSLTMRNRDGRIVHLRPEGVADVIGAFADQLRCVVLVSCFSDALAQHLRDEIGIVVGMKSSVDDEAAIEFVCAFYNALARGHSIGRAFRVAAGMMRALGEDMGDPILYVRDGTDPMSIMFGAT